MKAIFLFFFFFFLTLTLTSFKKSFLLKHFTEVIKGKVIEVLSTDHGVFLLVQYPVGENKAIYKHRFSPIKLSEKKLEFLISKYLDSVFFLLGRKENDNLVEIRSYANVKIVKWIYLLGSLLTGYFFFL